MALLNEECVLPKGSDQGLLNKLHQSFASTAAYTKPARTFHTMFGLVHYSGNVTYEIDGFLDKNKDNLIPDLVHMIEESTFNLARVLFPPDLSDSGRYALPHTAGRRPPRQPSALSSRTSSPIFSQPCKRQEFTLSAA